MHMPIDGAEVARVNGLLPGLAELVAREDGRFDILVDNVRFGEPGVVWRSGLTLAQAEALAGRMGDEGDIRFYSVGVFSDPPFDFADLDEEDEDDGAASAADKALRRDVRERVEAGLRVPGWWWHDDEEESRAAAVAQAIADASDALAFDRSGIDTVKAIGMSAIDEGSGVYRVAFFCPVTEDPDRDPRVILTLHIEEEEEREVGDEGEDGAEASD